MKTYSVHIKSTAPMLQNRLDPMDLFDKSRRKLSYEEETDPKKVGKKLHKDEKGNICQPAKTIKATLVNAAARYPYKRQMTYKTLFQGGVRISSDMTIHEKQDWVIDEQVNTGGKVGGSGAQLLVRPKLPEWELKFEIEVINEDISSDTLKSVLEYAGTYFGLGSRIQDGFGKFEVVEFRKN